MYVAEYLPNLQTVSVKADFSDPVTSITQLSVTSTAQLVLKSTNTEVLAIDLPYDTKTHRVDKITSLRQSNNVLSVSVSLTGQGTVLKSSRDDMTSFMNLSSSSSVKWSVHDLLAKTPANEAKVNQFAFVCGGCERAVINSNDFSKFRDMPSELWYEMMEFWHCHKPHESHSHSTESDHSTEKDHSIKYEGSALQPGPDEVLIGSSYLLVHESAVPEAPHEHVHCRCGQLWGNKSNQSVKIFKWNVSLKYGDSTESFPSYLHLYYLLIDRVNSTANRNYKIVNEANDEVVWIWIVSVGIDVNVSGDSLKNGLKLLYRLNQGATGDSIDTESIILPIEVFQNCIQHLQALNAKLPESNRSVPIQENGTTVLRQISYLA